MIRVLNVISGLNNAGTEAVVMNYYRNMDREKIQFDFLVLDTGKGYYEEEINELGGKIYKIPAFTSSPLKNIRLRKKFFKEHKYDIVEVHSPSALRFAYCKIAKKRGAKAVIFHVHNSIVNENFLVRYARKQLDKYCDQTVTCSDFAAICTLGKSADKVIPNAIDYEKYAFCEEIRREVRSFYNVSDDEILIGNIGRFSTQKNQSFLLKAFAEASLKNTKIKLLLDGFGELREQLSAEISELGLQDKIIMVKEAEFNVSKIYSGLDLFVMPSLYEGLAVVLIEAQANGLKIIGSTNLSKESDITDSIEFVELDKDEWVKRLADGGSYGRKSTSREEFAETGYEIKTAAAERQEEYFRMVEKWS